MVGARTATAAVGLLGSLVVSAVLWWYFDSLLFFLVVPFVPILFGDREDRLSARTCPTCGFETTAPDHEYCPRDGTRLKKRP
jgi:hypothetical protein